MAHDSIFISWEEHRRTAGLCAGLGLPLFVLTDEGSRLMRYVHLGARTLRLIARHKPRVVITQNPSLMLAILARLARPFIGRYKLVVDAHNEAVEPYINTQWPIPQLAHWVMRTADLTIVTSAALAQEVIRHGGRPLVLPDRLPEVPSAPPPRRIADVVDIMVIATYAPDEPICDILDAARNLGERYRFRFTGKESRLPRELRATLPANVQLMGFLPEDKYWQLMADSHLVLDLSLMPNCLVCGAYEALALGRPLILSDTAGGRELFGRVAIFTEPTSSSIARAVREAHSQFDALTTNMETARRHFIAAWERSAFVLEQHLKQPQTSHRAAI